MRSVKSRIFLAILGLVLFGGISVAGSLEPPGPPAPTMKDLNDVEPRIAIRNDFDTLTPIVISFPGSYYLAEDISAFPGAHGIEITTDNVTLDMLGFSVIGNTEVGSLNGIQASGMNNIVIRNGRVRDFFGSGVLLNGGTGGLVENVHATSNGLGGFGNGIHGGHGVVRQCFASDNFGSGISISGGAIVNSVSRVNNGDGFWIAWGVIEGSMAFANGGNGINGSFSALITNNVVGNNGLSGIFSNATSLIIANTATGNIGPPIDAAGSTIVDNETN